MTLPDGFYAVPDPDDESVMTRWRVKGGKWSPHPAKTWYGPARPLRKDAPDAPGTDAYIAWMRAHFDQYDAWRRRTLAAIEANPLLARWRFAESTAHCNNCGRALTDGSSRLMGIGPDCRDLIPSNLLAAYLTEVNRARRTTTTKENNR